MPSNDVMWVGMILSVCSLGIVFAICAACKHLHTISIVLMGIRDTLKHATWVDEQTLKMLRKHDDRPEMM